jgi:hypothetical protein
VKFWESSAIVPLLVEEETTVLLRDLYMSEPGRGRAGRISSARPLAPVT